MTDTNGELTGRESLLKKAERRYELRTLPVSKHLVRIQSLTEKEVSEYQTSVLSKRGPVGSYSRSRMLDANRRLIVLCLVDRAGKRLLCDQDVDALADWDSADSSYLYEQCAAHCGLNREDVEDLVKNSGVALAE